MNENTGKFQNPVNGELIDLIPFTRALLKRWWLILLAALIVGTGFCARAKMTYVPTYRASFTAYISSTVYSYDGTNRVTWSDISTARSLIPTYAAILSSKPVIEKAIEESGVNYNYWQLASAVSVESVNDTEIIEVSVTTGNPDVSYKIATALETAQADLVQEIVPGSNMTVLVPTEYPGGSPSPNYQSSAIQGALVGAALMIAILLAVELLDNRVKNTDELERRYGIVVVGTIHDLTASAKGRYNTYSYGKKGK